MYSVTDTARMTIIASKFREDIILYEIRHASLRQEWHISDKDITFIAP